MTRKFRFAIIGCGKVAIKHLKAAMHNDSLVELVAVADTSLPAMDSLIGGSKLSGTQKSCINKYSDYRKMLADENLDIVAVTTPSGTHASIGYAVIAAGVNLLLEKPMTLSLSESKMLIDEAVNHNVKIALGHIYRFFPIVDMLSEDIAKGVFGKVLYGNVKVFWGHDQAYYNQAAWRGTWAQDGGVLMNQSVHALDLMLYLMDGSVSEVTSMIARQSHIMEAEDLALGIMKFDDGSYCTVEGTTNTNPKDMQASFFLLCSKGSINAGIRAKKPFFDIRDENGKKMNGKYIKALLVKTHKESGILSLRQLSNPHSGILKDLCISIRDNKNPRADGNSGKNSLELVLAMYKSAKTKSIVSLPIEDFAATDMQGFFDN